MSTRTRTLASWAFPITLLAVGVSLSLPAASSDPSPAGVPASPGHPRVATATVEAAEVQRSARLSGVTRAQRRARLAFEVGGRVVARDVEVGARFRRGQILARLDGRQLDNAVTAATAAVVEVEARLAQQERERERANRLLEAGAISREAVEQTEANVGALRALRDAAVARAAEAQRTSIEGVLRAPFDGTVVAVGLQPGEFAQPGATVVEIAGDGPVEVEFEVPETFIEALRPGQPVEVGLPFVGRTVPGRVLTRGGATGGAGRLFPVVVAVDPDRDVLPGMTAEVTVVSSGRRALSVPLAAVLNPGGTRPAVFRLDGGRVRRVEVELYGIDGQRVTFSGPLQPGDRVVVTGVGLLADGDEVEVRS
jgi:RND family efflux transporter MFP subunit